MLWYYKSFTNFVEKTAIQNTPARHRDAKAVRGKKKKKNLGYKCLGYVGGLKILLLILNITHGYWKELKTLPPYSANQLCKDVVRSTQSPGTD